LQQFSQSFKLSSAFWAASREPKNSTEHRLPFSSLSHFISALLWWIHSIEIGDRLRLAFESARAVSVARTARFGTASKFGTVEQAIPPNHSIKSLTFIRHPEFSP
jgi:hypothetical protein